MGEAPKNSSLETRPSANTVKERSKYHIPIRFLQSAHPDVDSHTKAPEHETGDASSPVIVFINPKSGGKCGPMLLKLLRRQLGELQVLDIQQKDERPDVVLKALFQNLDRAVKDGDKSALQIKKNLRVVAAGGDGTVAWVLSTIKKLGVSPPPAVGVLPLGTGNGISVNLGWGKKTQPRSLKGRTKADAELEAIMAAEIRPIDSFNIDIVAEDERLIGELPNPIRRQADNDSETGPKGARASGDFWYYLTVGLDAEVAYRFHTLREERPWLSPTRKFNIFWYMWATCASGWFCCPTPLQEKMSLKKKNPKSGEWDPVNIPRKIEAIIFINLQSYTGSRDLWGLHDDVQDNQRGERVPIYDDGIIEVIGLESAGQSLLALTNLWRKIHGRRLAQGSEFLIEMAKDDNDTHMRVDGEPWHQRLPGATSGEDPLKVKVALSKPGRVLVNTPNLPEKNRTTRLWSDMAGTAKSGSPFKGDGATVVADHPQPQLKQELAASLREASRTHSSPRQDHIHLFNNRAHDE